MRAVSKQRAFSPVAIITSVLFAANIGAQDQVVTGGAAAPGGSEACDPPPAKLIVEVKQSDNKGEVRVTLHPDDLQPSGGFEKDKRMFFRTDLEFAAYILLSNPPDSMTQIDPPTVQGSQAASGSTTSTQAGAAAGSEESVPKYTKPSDKATPKDPKLTAWEGMRGLADSLDASGDPYLIRLARAIRIQAESIFQAPAGGVSSAKGATPTPPAASNVETQGGRYGVLRLDRSTSTLSPISPVPSGVTTQPVGLNSGFSIEVKIPWLSNPSGFAAVTYEPPLLPSIFRTAISPDLFANIAGFWTEPDANRTPSVPKLANDFFYFEEGYAMPTLKFFAKFFALAAEAQEILAGKPLSFLPIHSVVLMAPRLHVEADEQFSSGFLVVRSKEEVHADQAYQDNITRVLTSLGEQVILENTFPWDPGASHHIGWWPKNGLAEAKPTSPNTRFNSFDVSKISPFFKHNVAHVSSWINNADCLAIFLDAAKPSFTEPNAGRNVAPAPSLDPAYWPKSQPEPLRVSLSAAE